MTPPKITLAEKFAQFSQHWTPHVIGEVNGLLVKVAKIQGTFDWHRHDKEDELFLVVEGSFRLEFRDDVVELVAGDMIIVPRGVEHRPVADAECQILMVEPASTLNTGTVRTERTVEDLKYL